IYVICRPCADAHLDLHSFPTRRSSDLNFPQGGGLEEVYAYVEVIGMSEEEALLTATRNAARVIGFDEAGTLEPGKFADLLERPRSEEHTSELQSPDHLVCRLLLEKKKQ